jgi:hypothetical protein
MMTPILDTHKTLMRDMRVVRFSLQKQKLQKRKGASLFFTRQHMRYEFVDDVVLSPVAVKGLPEEAWERAESSRRVGTTCLVLRDDHSQEGVVIDYVTTLTSTGWDRSLIIYYVTTPYREYDEHHMWIAASEEIQARFTESWWQIRMSHQVMERGN